MDTYERVTGSNEMSYQKAEAFERLGTEERTRRPLAAKNVEGMGNMRQLAQQSGFDFLRKQQMMAAKQGGSGPVHHRQDPIHVQSKYLKYPSKYKVNENNPPSGKIKRQLRIDGSFESENNPDIYNIQVLNSGGQRVRKQSVTPVVNKRASLDSKRPSTIKEKAVLPRTQSQKQTGYRNTATIGGGLTDNFNYRPTREQFKQLTGLAKNLSSECSQHREGLKYLESRVVSLER